MSWEAKGKTATSGFGRRTGEKHLKRSNWNGSALSGGKAENGSQAETRNIYLTGKSPHAGESSKFAFKQFPKTQAHKFSTKMNYFMETMDRKGQIQQLELQNRQLRIEFKKARQAYLELQYKDRQRHEEEGEETDLQEREKFAENIVGLKEEIGDLKDELIAKYRQLECLKLVRKEISETELKSKAEIVEAECESYRAQAFKLMQKYPGYGEQDGMDEEDHHTYRYNNLVLSEYDALLNELVQTLEKVEIHKQNRLVDREKFNEKVMKLKDDVQKQTLHFRECEDNIAALENQKTMSSMYSKERIDEMKKKKEELHNKQLILDEELAKLKKEDEQAQKNRAQHMETLSNRIVDEKKKYDMEMQRYKKENAEDRSEDMHKNEKDDLGIAVEKKKVEKMRPVRFFQIENAANDLNRRLFIRSIPIEDALKILIPSEDGDSYPKQPVILSSLEASLRREPFYLNKEEAKLVARYLVEDNYEDTVEYDAKRSQAKCTVESIFKNLVGHVMVLPLETIRKMFREIHERVNEKKAILISKMQDKDKKDTVPITKFIEEIKAPTSGIADLDEIKKKLLIDTLIERAEGAKEIRIAAIFEYFSEKEFEVFFVNSAYRKQGRKGGQKLTTASASGKHTSKRDSQSDAGEDLKKNDLRHTVSEVVPKTKGFGDSMDRESTNKPDIKSKSNLPIEEDMQEKSYSEDSDGLSRVSDDVAPPLMMVSEVKTFNDPETQEKIYTLEQIKAAGQVKNALGIMMFGKKQTEVIQDSQAGKEERKSNPLVFNLGKKPTDKGDIKGDQFNDSKAKDQAREPLAEKVQKEDSPVQKTDPKPIQPEVKGKNDPAEPKPVEDSTPKQVNPSNQKQAKQPLILSDDDNIDEDDEIDRMLAANKDYDEF